MDHRENTFELTIDFKRGEGDPARVFRTMSGLLDAFQSLDSHLVGTFDVSLDTALVLDDVSSGSIRARIRNIIGGIPDEALRDGEFKKVLGYFLLRGKYALLEWLNEREEIEHREDLKVLEGELITAAEKTGLLRLPAYSSPKAEALLTDIHQVQESLANLDENDEASYRYGDKSVSLNRSLTLSPIVIREVLTREVVKTSGERIIKVKKPDYLGQSMWWFRYDGRAIEAKVTDISWVHEFQARRLIVKPGDSLRVVLYEEISYGYEGEVVHRHYEVENVKEIIRPEEQVTLRL